MTAFTPRLSAPSRSSKYYYSGNPYYQNGVGIPNCTCYAFGRVYEITNKYPDLPDDHNASTWYNLSASSYKRGQTPKLGAVMCWSGGDEGYGHVAVVEKIKDNGDVVYSESWWEKLEFGTGSTTKDSGYFFQSGYRFQGFIYACPEFENTSNGTNSTLTASQILYPATRPTTTQANPLLIWQYLILKIKNPYGVAGLMGNLYHESALLPINLETSREDDIGYSDEGYTEAINNGSYPKNSFINDSAGYGLAQWTWHTRKEAFYNFWKSKGGSIGNLITQLDFLYNELSTGYPTVLTALKNATSVKDASDTVLLDFEAPENKGTSVQNQRASTGSSYYDKYKNITETSLGSNSATEATNPEAELEETLTFWLDVLAIGEVEE